MLRQLYNALWYPALPVALALSGASGDAGTRRARLGTAWAGDGATRSAEPRIWAHAASVGEVGALRAVAAALLSERPDATLVITTMTETGRDAARRSGPVPDGVVRNSSSRNRECQRHPVRRGATARNSRCPAWSVW